MSLLPSLLVRDSVSKVKRKEKLKSLYMATCVAKKQSRHPGLLVSISWVYSATLKFEEVSSSF